MSWNVQFQFTSSTRIFVYLFACLLVVCLFVYLLFACLLVVCLFVYLLFACLFVCLFACCLLVCLFVVCLFVYLFACLFICLLVFCFCWLGLTICKCKYSLHRNKRKCLRLHVHVRSYPLTESCNKTVRSQSSTPLFVCMFKTDKSNVYAYLSICAHRKMHFSSEHAGYLLLCVRKNDLPSYAILPAFLFTDYSKDGPGET